MASHLTGLPEECLIYIFQVLSIKELIVLACTNKLFRSLISDDFFWKKIAMAKWGVEVGNMNRTGEWQKYVQHRLPTVSLPQQISPLNLLQEPYQEPWSHIACCLLCSRTTGSDTVRQAVNTILTKWPTPTAILQADNNQLLQTMNPLGLQQVRMSALINMSRSFLEDDWACPSEFKGCGRFVADSFKIFCRGHRTASSVDDVNLSKYLRWLLSEGKSSQTCQKKKTRKHKRRVLSPKKPARRVTRAMRSTLSST